MKAFNYTINGKKYAVELDAAEGNQIPVKVNGETYVVELETKEEEKKPRVVVTPPKPAAPKPSANPDGSLNTQDALKAPLPGVIKDICVNVGDEVTEGQTLVVLEAMKMANNLDSEKSGKVAAILVEVGASVMENTPLVIIE